MMCDLIGWSINSAGFENKHKVYSNKMTKEYQSGRSRLAEDQEMANTSASLTFAQRLCQLLNLDPSEATLLAAQATQEPPRHQ
jgi:hypothetical protein